MRKTTTEESYTNPVYEEETTTVIATTEEEEMLLGGSIKAFELSDDDYSVLDLVPFNRTMLKSIEGIEITREELNDLVDAFEAIKKIRIAVGNRISAVQRGCDGTVDTNNSIYTWYFANLVIFEKNIEKIVKKYVENLRIGRWLLSIKGIGHLHAAKLIANFDVTKATHYNQFHSYAGLNDNNRPWLAKHNLAEKIVDGTVENNRPILDTIRTTFENENIDEDEKMDYIYHIMNNMDKDSHYKVKIIEEVVNAKADDDEKKEIIRRVVNDEIKHGEEIVIGKKTIIVPKKYKDVIDDYTIAIISKKSQWSIRYLEKNGRSNKGKGKFTREQLIKACKKIPYNAELKARSFLIGESFVRVYKKGSLYGRLYKERKAYEIKMNEEGKYAEEAAKKLANYRFAKKDVQAIYESGKLPPGHIERRARRYAVKMFYAHVFEAMYYYEYGKKAPDPYPLSYMGHVDYVEPEVPFESVE